MGDGNDTVLPPGSFPPDTKFTVDGGDDELGGEGDDQDPLVDNYLEVKRSRRHRAQHS